MVVFQISWGLGPGFGGGEFVDFGFNDHSFGHGKHPGTEPKSRNLSIFPPGRLQFLFGPFWSFKSSNCPHNCPFTLL